MSGKIKMAVECGFVHFLCYFAQDHVDFRIPELHAVSSLFDFESQYEHEEHSKESPFLVINLPNEECATKLLSRVISLRSMYELWGSGTNLLELVNSVKSYPQEKMNLFCSGELSFKINIETFNKKLPLTKQKEYIEEMSFVPFKGPVNLKSPDLEFALLLDYGNDPNVVTQEPIRLFFGRKVGDGQRNLIQKYSLKKRHFIGNTSMDAQLSFLMANQGQARPGSFIYDPFVGTGSILVSCAHFGSYVAGSDINRTLLHGRGRPSRANSTSKWRERGESVLANFRQYGLESQFVDVLVSEAGRLGLREVPLFDAIITDPPYGVREGTRKMDPSGAGNSEDLENKSESSSSAVKGCCLSDIILTLMDLAARYLVLHGRLVYWLPVYRPSFSETQIPTHPCLQLVASSEQVLQRTISRRLVTMEKVKEFKEGDVDLYSINAQFLDACNNFRDNYFSSSPAT